MPLYLYDGKLLVTDDHKLAASDDCCCGCQCCAGGPPASHAFRVSGVIESTACTAADPSDNCTALNRDYVWSTPGTCKELEDGRCQIYQTQSLGMQLCGWTSTWADMWITWDATTGRWEVDFQIVGSDGQNNYLILAASTIVEDLTAPASCTAQRSLPLGMSILGCVGSTGWGVIYQPTS